MANSGGGVILVGIKEIDGRPLEPLRLGLQNVSKPDQQINRLTQMLTTEFGNLGPPKEIRSIEVMKKNVVLIKIFPTVTGFLRPREGKFAERNTLSAKVGSLFGGPRLTNRVGSAVPDFCHAALN